MNIIPLKGCTPEPLMNYLKALGVFRLVAEQTDPDARLSWIGGVAQLHSRLDHDELVNFFLDAYRPTPIVAPWGARSGFYPGSSESSARAALNAIVDVAGQLPRLELFRDVIVSIRDLLQRRGYTEKVKDEDKLHLMQICRNNLPDVILPWLDAVFVLTDDSRKFPPLLGTGGNEGSGSYVSTFAQVIGSLLIDRENDSGVGAALFGDFTSSVGGLAVGHFNPGAIGGANSAQGFDGGGGVNAWDYLLALEGCLLFAGAAARRYGADAVGRAAYPFCVEAVAVGYGSASDKEAGESTRAELWLPLWTAPVRLTELTHLFAEGRAQFGRRQARNSVEFALALATLGVSRGIDSFIRYAFVMRNGLAYFAAPLGRVEVNSRPKARLLDDPALLQWIDRLRAACRDKERTPARYQISLRQIDRAMFAFANRSEHGNDVKYLVDVLCAVGRAEHTLANGLSFCTDKYIRPLHGLDPQWLDQADDGSPEFRLAVGLAGIQATRKREVGPLRVFIEPVEVNKFVNWLAGSTSAVWSKQPLADNLAGVFRRRQMEAFRKGVVGVPLYSPRPSRLDDVLAFLREETDDDKLHDLLWGLIAVDYPSDWKQPERADMDVPFEFGVPRLLVQKRSFIANGEYWNLSDTDANAKPDPDVFHLLAYGRADTIGQCVTRAARRLKSGGLLVNGYCNRGQTGQPLTVVSPFRTERLLAAMLFPLSDLDLQKIANYVLNPPGPQE